MELLLLFLQCCHSHRVMFKMAYQFPTYSCNLAILAEPLFTASYKIWLTQGTLSQPSSLDGTVMLLALSCTSATMYPSKIPYSTHACLREMAMFSPVCRSDISFVNSTFLWSFYFSFIQWTVSVVYDFVIQLVHKLLVNEISVIVALQAAAPWNCCTVY